MKKSLFLLLIFSLTIVLSLLFVSAQQSLSAIPWGSNDNHEVWHSGEDVQVKIGGEYYSLQDSIDDNMNSESLWTKNEHNVSHHAAHVKVKIGDRYFSLQRVISYGLQFLTGVNVSSNPENVQKTFTVREADKDTWKKVCTTSEGYNSSQGDKYALYTRAITAEGFGEGVSYSINCKYEDGDPEQKTITFNGNYQLVAQGEESHIRWAGLTGNRDNSLFGKDDSFKYYLNLQNGEFKVKVIMNDGSECPIYKARKGFGLRSETVYQFGSISCTIDGQLACTKELRACSNGSSVSRNESLNCEFNPCPGE
jgi:hypothetical protein